MKFIRVKKPAEVKPEVTLEEEIEKSDGTDLHIYYINLVVISGHDLPNMDTAFDKSDPYCVVEVDDISNKTPTIDNDLNPEWNTVMNFFVAKMPEKITFKVWDEDSYTRDDYIGIHEFSLGNMFATKGSFDGKLDLKSESGEHRGQIHVTFSCAVYKPVETEIKLKHTETLLECKANENEQLNAAFDESERLREETINQLSLKEQEIVQQAAEIALKHEEYSGELSKKEETIMDQAQKIEMKVKEKEEIEVNLREIELKKKEVELKLTEAEKDIIKKGEELEEKQKQSEVELTAKETAILAAAAELEAKETEYQKVQKQLEQNEALRSEIQNELTLKETIILKQAQEIEEKAKAEEELSKKLSDLLAKSEELKVRDRKAADAQKAQDQAQDDLNKMKANLDRTQAELNDAREEVKKLQKQEKEPPRSAFCGCFGM